jgi:hypothetical protein
MWPAHACVIDCAVFMRFFSHLLPETRMDIAYSPFNPFGRFVVTARSSKQSILAVVTAPHVGSCVWGLDQTAIFLDIALPRENLPRNSVSGSPDYPPRNRSATDPFAGTDARNGETQACSAAIATRSMFSLRAICLGLAAHLASCRTYWPALR